MNRPPQVPTEAGSAPRPAGPAAAGPPSGPTWDRLEDQLGWYDRKSASCQRMFKRLKVLQLVAAALVPVTASVDAAVWITGGLGALVVVVEGIQQLGQYQQNWMNYRSTAEALNHEKYLYLAGAGHFHGADDPQRMLAEHVEGLLSQEHAKWTAARQESAEEEKRRAERDEPERPAAP